MIRQFLNRALVRVWHRIPLGNQGDQTHNRKIARGIVLNSVFVFLARSMGAIKEFVIALRFGTSTTVDALVLSSSLVSWLPGMISNLVSHSLIPIAVRERRKTGQRITSFDQQVFGYALILGVFLAVGTFFAVPAFLPALAGNENPQVVALAITVSQILSPIGFIGLISGICTSLLVSHSLHVNTLVEASMPFAIIVVLLIWVEQSVGPLVLGTLCGALLFCILQIYVLARNKALPRPQFSFRRLAEPWRELGSSTSIMSVGVVIMSVTPMIDQILAVSQGPGSNSSLGYALRVSSLLTSLFASAIVRSILPVLSDAVAQAQRSEALRVTALWFLVSLLLGTVVAVVFSWFSHDVIRLLFERGAFTSDDTTVVSDLFSFALLQLPFHVSALVLIQLQLARSAFTVVAAVSVAAGIGKIVSSYVLIEPFGLTGLLIGTAIMNAILMIAHLAHIMGSRQLSPDRS